jgi:hypothetical protein
MSSRLLYAVAAAENLLVFGADVSNAFAHQHHHSLSDRIEHSTNGGSITLNEIPHPKVI